MKLVSMKVTPAERRKQMEPSSVATEGPAYPWGLSLNLDGDALTKLGLDTTGLKVGASLKLEALVDVQSVSQHESQGGTQASVSLQITDLAVGAEAESADDTSDKLYAKGE